MERTDLGRGAAIGTFARFDDHRAHSVLFERLELSSDVGAPSGALLFGELIFLYRSFELIDLSHASVLVGIFERSAHLVEERLDTSSDGRIRHVNRPFARLRSDLSKECALLFTECFDGFLAKGHRSEHILFRDLLSASFDHGDIVGGTRDGEFKIGILILFNGGIHDEFARLDIATDAYAGSRSIEWSACAHECSRSAHNGDAIGQILRIEHERRCHDVHFLLEAISETRTDRTVDHTRSEDAMIRRLRLALEISSRDAADRIHFLDEVDGKGEEIVVLLRLRDDRRYEHGGIALSDDHCTGCLLGKLTSGKGVLFPVEFECSSDFFHVSFFLFLPAGLQ